MSGNGATFPKLPCYPCPYQASCCAYGTTLTAAEAVAIEAAHGPGVVYLTRWGEWRTRVRNKRCVLFRDGGCTIHDKPYYPEICGAFPWTDIETGGPYQYDVSICGEFIDNPELVALQRATRQGNLNGPTSTRHETSATRSPSTTPHRGE